MIATSVAAVLVGVWLAVTDLPSQIFGIGLASSAFCVLVYAFNDLRRSVDRARRENARLRDAMFKLVDSRSIDPKTKQALEEVMRADVDPDEEVS